MFSMVQQPQVGQGLLNIDASRSQSDTRHSVGLLGRSGQPAADIYTWQHTTLKKRYPCPGEIRTHNPSKRAVADPSLRPVLAVINIYGDVFNTIRSVHCDYNQPIHQQTHTIYIKSWIIHAHEPCYMFRRYIASVRDTQYKDRFRFYFPL
jgi:hypothetical protein